MANAKMCDRCGKFYTRYNEKKDSKKTNSLIRANTDEHRKYWTHDVIELCPECMADFGRWFEEVRDFEKLMEEQRNDQL